MADSFTERADRFSRAGIAERLSLRGDGLDRLLWLSTLLVAASIIFSTALVQVAVVALTVLWVWDLVRARGRGFRWTPFHLPVIGIAGARLISILLSTNPGASAPALYTEVFFYVLFFIVADVLSVDPQRRAVILVQLLLYTAVVASLVGSAKYVLGIDSRATSTTAGYYTLGLYLCALFPFALALGRQREIFPSRLVWWLVWCVIAAGVVFTFNRLHWVGMAAAVLVVGVILERRLLAVFAIGACVVALVVPGVADRLYQIVTFTSSSSGRDVLWRGAFMLFDKHPVFGFGPRTFADIFPLFGELPDKGIGSWHNDYLQIYMESGLAGLGALVWLIVIVYSRGITAYRRGSLPLLQKNLVLALLLSVSMFFVAGGVLDTLDGLLFRMLLALLAILVGSTACGPVTVMPAEDKGSRS